MRAAITSSTRKKQQQQGAVTDTPPIRCAFRLSLGTGGEEGVQLYVQKLKAELADTMRMCGAHSLADIDRSMLYGF